MWWIHNLTLGLKYVSLLGQLIKLAFSAPVKTDFCAGTLESIFSPLPTVGREIVITWEAAQRMLEAFLSMARRGRASGQGLWASGLSAYLAAHRHKTSDHFPRLRCLKYHQSHCIPVFLSLFDTGMMNTRLFMLSDTLQFDKWRTWSHGS